MERIVLPLAVGTGGAFLARRIKMPGGSLLGAMLATGILSLLVSDSQPLPDSFRSVALVLLGTYTGSSLDREALGRIRAALPVAAGTILVLIGAAVALGWVLYSRSAREISALTVVLGTMPGGASGLAAVAYDLGAEAEVVVSLHMMRQIIVFGALPLLLRWLATSGLSKRHPETSVE